MSVIDIKKARSRLEQLLAELTQLNDGAEQGSAIVDLDQSRVGRLSRMDALQNQAISQTAMFNRAQLIQQVKSAIKRIDTGEYGICVNCEEPINPRRLDHNPAAPLCIRCAALAEKQ